MYFKPLSPSLRALQEELSTGLHPKLAEVLSKIPISEFEERVAAIATYCNVAMDGEYTEDDLDKVYDILWHRLQTRREHGHTIVVRQEIPLNLPLPVSVPRKQ